MDLSLCYAIDRNDLSNLKHLINRGSNVDSKDSDGRTAIHRAAINGHCEIFLYLLNRGADINIKDNNGNTLLHNAVIGDNIRILQTLLDKGFSITEKNNKNLTPLELSEEWFSFNSTKLFKAKIQNN